MLWGPINAGSSGFDDMGGEGLVSGGLSGGLNSTDTKCPGGKGSCEYDRWRVERVGASCRGCGLKTTHTEVGPGPGFSAAPPHAERLLQRVD